MDPQLQGLFKWSMEYHDDTTRSKAHAPMSEEDRKWVQEALAQNLQNVGKRMQEITGALNDAAEGVSATTEEKEALLNELQEIIEHIDYARDFAKMGGLPTLLDLTNSEHPSLRASAAEVLATSMQGNAPVQQRFMADGGLQRLLQLYQDEDLTSQTKALLALSALIRHNESGLQEFLQQHGLQLLIEALSRPVPRLQRKALQLLQYILQSQPRTQQAACRAGLVAPLVACLGSNDMDLRASALLLAAELSQSRQTLSTLKQDPNLLPELESIRVKLDALEPEDDDVFRDDKELCSTVIDALKQPLPSADEGQEQPSSGVPSRPLASDPVLSIGPP